MLGGFPKRKQIPLGRDAAGPRRPPFRALQITLAALISAIGCVAAQAQNAPAPGFDPRAAERRFEAPQSDHPAPRLPFTPRGAATKANGKPLFVLRGIDVQGAHAMAPDVIAQTYQPYLGRRVSQADLAS